MARSALSGVLRLAVSANALYRNALREVGRVRAQAPKPVKRKSGQTRDTGPDVHTEARSLDLGKRVTNDQGGDAKFLEQLASKRILGRLAGLDMSPRKV